MLPTTMKPIPHKELPLPQLIPPELQGQYHSEILCVPCSLVYICLLGEVAFVYLIDARISDCPRASSNLITEVIDSRLFP